MRILFAWDKDDDIPDVKENHSPSDSGNSSPTQNGSSGNGENATPNVPFGFQGFPFGFANTNGNANCNSDNGLTPGQEHHVAVSIGQGFVDVSVNGLSVCDGVRKDRRAFSTVHVYASDPCMCRRWRRSAPS